jgi:hypothetical protein
LVPAHRNIGVNPLVSLGYWVGEIDWNAVAEMNPTVRAMIKAGTPLTRANFIDAKWGAPGGDDFPDEWTKSTSWTSRRPSMAPDRSVHAGVTRMLAELTESHGRAACAAMPMTPSQRKHRNPLLDWPAGLAESLTKRQRRALRLLCQEGRLRRFRHRWAQVAQRELPEFDRTLPFVGGSVMRTLRKRGLVQGTNRYVVPVIPSVWLAPC